MSVKKRHNMIVSIIRERGEARVDELTTICKKSPETIRRDLGELAKIGLVQKVHGGVRLPNLHGEGSFSKRMLQNPAGKAAIAHQLVSMLRPGDTVFMDTGSTTLFCAEAIVEAEGICVITNSIDIVERIGNADKLQAILLGGEYTPKNRQVTGPVTVRDISDYHANYAVITVSAVHEDVGVMDFNVREASIAQEMMDHAEHVIVVADYEKFDRRSTFRVAGFDAINHLISDRDLPESFMNRLMTSNTHFHLATQTPARTDVAPETVQG